MVDFKISGLKRRFLPQRSSVSSYNHSLDQQQSPKHHSSHSPHTSPASTQKHESPPANPAIKLPQSSPSEFPFSLSPSEMPAPVKKVWVRRNGSTADPTLVQLSPDQLVDEAKELILRRYSNSLGRQFDAPDVTIRLIPRSAGVEKTLCPDEVLWEVLDKAYPNGQKMDEALIIHVPSRHTPKYSPLPNHHHHHHHLNPPHQNQHHHHHHTQQTHHEDTRPHENGTDYFPPMPPAQFLKSEPPRAMTIITSGHVPPLISPGGRRSQHRTGRPTAVRHNTASPTSSSAPPLPNSQASRPSRHRGDSVSSEKKSQPSPSPDAPGNSSQQNATINNFANTNHQLQRSISPLESPRLASPRPKPTAKPHRPRKPIHASTMNSTMPELPGSSKTALPPSFIDTAVPPINILIVEDNMVNLKLLERFVRKLKVHWATAVNGKEAVDKWRQGGFHLVLMDLQLPIMSGLEATREIRRLERVNHIGVLSGSAHSSVPPDLSGNEEAHEEEVLREEDKLREADRLFKSSVIIVALTASYLQSDRHEALAAGCNDFLTKPVNFNWFERKVKEWGCMQALIDFDGWRKWKDAAVQNGLKDASTSDANGSLRKKSTHIRRIQEATTKDESEASDGTPGNTK